MNLFKYLYLVLALVISAGTTSAAAPNWTVNASSYQYSMTVVAKVELNCNNLTNPSNKIAVFVNGQIRGVAYTSNVVSGAYLATMTVYSNTTSSEKISFKFYNVSTDSVYNGVDSILFQENAAYGTVGNPFIVRNNNAPTAMQLSNSTVNEGQPVNTSIGSFSTTDIDAGETFTYSLVSGVGSTDNANFNISGSTLRTNVVLNYTAKSSHTIRVRATDANGCYYEKNYAITVNDVNTAPTQVYISDSTVIENSAALTMVGTFSALDNDLGDTYSYSLVSGSGSTDNAFFNILGTSIRTTSVFNYEVKSAYSIRVRVTDAAMNTFERVFTILVKDLNDAPTNVLLNGSSTGISFMENKTLSSILGTFTTTDEDAANSFTYSFLDITGNNNSNFLIVGNQLRTNALFDFETRQNYVIYVQTNDGNGGTFTKQLLLNVTDSNDVPTAINLTNTSITENNALKTFIAKLSATDADAVSNFSYSLVSGSGSGGNTNFSISNDTLYTNQVFDYEITASYSIRVNVNDGFGGVFQQTFSISILNGNDTPANVILATNQIAENSVLNTTIGSFTSIDQDAGNTFTYTLVSGTGATDNSAFNISGSNLRSSQIFDYETKSVYSIRVRTTDNGGLYFEKVFTINITDEIDVPTNIMISNDTINENMPLNTTVGNLNGVSQDMSVSFTYSLDGSYSGNDNSLFVISGSQLKSNAVFDFESKNTYNVFVKASVGSVSYSKLIQVFIRNQNDAPTDIALSTTTITENRPIGSFIGRFSSTDADLANTFTYALTSGVGSANNGSFRISNDSLYTLTYLDFELQNSYSIRVNTSDNAAGQFSKSFTIIVSDSNDAPTAVNLSANAVQENQAVATIVATFSSVDADAGQSFVYSLVSGTGSTDNNYFTIQGNQLRTNSVFNYEQQTRYRIRVQTNDGNGGIFSDTFSIYVLNVNDAPTMINLSNNATTENRPVNTFIGSLSTVDQDMGDVFVYTFDNTAGNDNDAFFINGNQLRSNISFNYEVKQIYNIYVKSSDGLASVTKHFLITIADSNDAPTNITVANAMVDENKPANTFITTFYTEDIDLGQTFTYALVSGVGSINNASFRISNDSLYTNAQFDFETKPNYTIRVKSTDNGNLSFEKQFSIAVGNANDAPTNITLSNFEITENKVIRSLIGSFSSQDQDLSNTFTYSLVGGTGSTDNSSFIIIGNELKSNRLFNYEQQSAFSIRVQSNDGNGGAFEKVFTISIIDSNDYPTNISLSNTLIAENRLVGSKICDITTTDQDAGDNFTYSFSNLAGNNNSNFFLIGNELRTNTVFDYETKNFYIAVITTTDALGGSFTRQFVINIKDSVDAPVSLEMSGGTINENESIDAYVGSLSANDPDQVSGFVYSLIPGIGSKDNTSFKVSNDSLLAAESFDYETKKIYNVRLRVTDVTGAYFERAFVININDANDAPTALSLSANALDENEPAHTEIGSFTTTDIDADDVFTYTFIGGPGSTDNSQFLIEGDKLRSNFSANFETKNSYTIRVVTQDKGGSTFESVFVIAINDISEKPAISPQTFTAEENLPVGTTVGKIVAQSQDAGANLLYSILGANEYFEVDEVTGDLKIKTGIDYEKSRRHTFSAVVKDNQAKPQYDTAVITVDILDAIESKQELPANNYMSPNNDGINDFFVVENVSLYADYSLTIYNEAGMQVYFIANQYQNNWDGSYNGNTLPAGVYFFVFKNNKTNTDFKGSINLTK